MLLVWREVLAQNQGGILGTRHNLSVTGLGIVKAISETEVCVFCHTPHNASPVMPPLWNRQFSSENYTPYDSPSLQAAVNQPNGYSKLCLSCHDGTIAIGAVRNLRGQSATIQMTGTGPGGVMPSGPTLIGTNLLNDHPISFVFDQALRSADGELVDPNTLTDRVQLYPGANAGVRDSVQCTTCHDPHTVEFPKFLRKNPKGQSDNLCLTCHQKPGWVGSTHESSTTFWPKDQTTEEVREHSCLACHTPHTAEGAERLLRNAALAGQSAIEETCYACHQAATLGGVAPDIQTEFTKTWRHPITLNPGGHRPVFITRPPAGLPENVLLNPSGAAEDSRFTDVKHVECVDCHNPHRVIASNRTEGMRGIALNGGELENVVNDPIPVDGQPSDRQYPLCFRCHGDTYDRVVGTTTLASGAQPGNKRLQFQTDNSAFHPVAGPGRNESANLNDQLQLNSLSINSVIKCTDCHNSNAYESTPGRVPSNGTTVSTSVGPHGSTYPSILRAQFLNTLPGPASWNPGNFNLCFRCHDETSLMARRTGDGARTNFYDDINGKDNLHWLHLDDRVDRSQPLCKSCHYNIHSNVEAPNTQYNIDGIISTTPPQGTPTRLINFHPNIRPIGGRAKPEWWFDSFTKERRCYLQCHNPDGSPGGEIMAGAEGTGGRRAVYRPPFGDLP
jgi:predicted CXXCH cytochrome family protein